MSKNEKKQSVTLADDEIRSERRVGRRGALGVLGAGIAGALAAGALGATQGARAQTPEELASDSDSGGNADPAGRGRTGHTDRDSGPQADRAGRGVCAERGHTDSDGGNNADQAGRGRGPCR